MRWNLGQVPLTTVRESRSMAIQRLFAISRVYRFLPNRLADRRPRVPKAASTDLGLRPPRRVHAWAPVASSPRHFSNHALSSKQGKPR